MRLTSLKLLLSAGLALAALAPTPAISGFPVMVDAVCPVDGKKFTYVTTGSYSTFGRHLDGMPIGSWTFPLALPQCPDSKLPLYRQFTDQEVEKLKQMVATPEYKAIAGETAYFVARYVMEKLGEPAMDQGWIMLQATWQAKADEQRYARYAAAFLKDADRMLATMDPSNEEWWGIQLFTINVARQAANWPEAERRLNAVMKTAGGPPKGFSEEFTATRDLLTKRSKVDHFVDPRRRAG